MDPLAIKGVFSMKAFKGEIRHTITGTRIYPYTFHQNRQLENITSIQNRGYGQIRNPITGYLIPDY